MNINSTPLLVGQTSPMVVSQPGTPQVGMLSTQPMAMNPGVITTNQLKTTMLQQHQPEPQGPVLHKLRLSELVKEVDPNEQLDEDVEEALLQIADDFIENVVTSSCLIAKHRKANTLDIRDVQMNLERNWNIWLPGFGTDELRPYKKPPATEAHKQRMALIRKTLKK